MQSLESRVKSVFSSKVAKGLFASLALAAAANAADLGISPAYRQYAPQDEEKKAGMPNEILRLAPKSNYARIFSFSFTGNTNNLTTILEDGSGAGLIAPPPKITETNGAVTVTYCIPSVLQIGEKTKPVEPQPVPAPEYKVLPESFTLSVLNDGKVMGSEHAADNIGMIAHIDFAGAYKPTNTWYQGAISTGFSHINSLFQISSNHWTTSPELKGLTDWEMMMEGVNPDLKLEGVSKSGWAKEYAILMNAAPRFGGSQMIWTFDDNKTGEDRYLTIQYRTHGNNDIRGKEIEVLVNGQLLDPNGSSAQHAFYPDPRGVEYTDFISVLPIGDKTVYGQNKIEFRKTEKDSVFSLEDALVSAQMPALNYSPEKDSDGDGFKDWDEIRLGMDAMDAGDQLKLEHFRKDGVPYVGLNVPKFANITWYGSVDMKNWFEMGSDYSYTRIEMPFSQILEAVQSFIPDAKSIYLKIEAKPLDE